MDSKKKRVKPGGKALLTEVPPGLLKGLPKKDQKAISEMVGKPVLFVGYDEDGRAELEFTDSDGDTHFIYVSPDFVESVT